jgi:hypothetical protein
MRILAAAFSSCAMFLCGCAYIGPQSFRHVIEDRTGTDKTSLSDGRVGTLALVAERRMVLVKYANGRFCAEPPPDAVDNLSAALSAALSGEAKGVSGSASVAASVASYAKQLFYRTQGLQLYRDGIFALCTQFLNEGITAEQMDKRQEELLKVAADLIKAEIPQLKEIKCDSGGIPTLPAVPELPQKAQP